MSDTNKQEEILLELYEQWRAHPVTAAFFKVLKNHNDEIGKLLMGNSYNKEITDQQIRLLAYGMKTNQTTIELLSDFNIFSQHMKKIK